jgi:hypothetical protein
MNECSFAQKRQYSFRFLKGLSKRKELIGKKRLRRLGEAGNLFQLKKRPSGRIIRGYGVAIIMKYIVFSCTAMAQITETQNWDGIERRNQQNIRRSGERRSQQERRNDPRLHRAKQRHINLLTFFRTLKHMRLGVDRRKNAEQRILPDRRNLTLRSLLSKEEIEDLLK